MTKKSFQDSVDWDDIMFEKHPDENGHAAEWDNFNVTTNVASDTAKSAVKPQSTTKESKKEPRKGSKKSSTSSSTDRCPDSPTAEGDDRSRTVRKPSSTKHKSPKRERAREHHVQRHDDDSDSDNDNDDDDDLDGKHRKASTNSKRASQLSSRDSNRHRSRSPSVSRRQIHRSPSVSRRKERQSVPTDKKDDKKPAVSSKIKREKRSGDDDASVRNKDNEAARESRKHGDDASVRRAAKEDATTKNDGQKKLKEKKEKNRKVDEDDNQTLSQSSTHRREVSVRKSRSVDDKLDDKSVDTRDSSRLRRRNGQLNAEQLSQSRQRAVQRMEARNSWRESQRKSGTCSDADDDRTIDDSRRASLLDQSRRGPIRSIRYDDDDDDDDDFSVLSGVSSSFTVNDTIDAPFIAKNIKSTVPGSGHGGGYLPNSLNHTNTNDSDTFRKKERRPSAFGTGYERAQALNQLKSTLDHNDDSDGESSSSYMLPTSLSRSAGAQFEIDRSGRGGASTRRPSLSTTLVIPCINGVDDSDNEDDLYSKSMDRRGSLSSKELDQPERRGSLSTRNVDDESDSNNKKGYDSTVEDMLKSRRLRGARGDAAKKKEETKKVKKTRGLSISMLTNLVHSGSKTTTEPPAVGSSAHRRASTTM